VVIHGWDDCPHGYTGQPVQVAGYDAAHSAVLRMNGVPGAWVATKSDEDFGLRAGLDRGWYAPLVSLRPLDPEELATLQMAHQAGGL
jgi:hypothetical protein